MCVSAHPRVQVCRPEGRGKCFALSLSTCSFGTESLPESGAGPEASKPQRSLCLHLFWNWVTAVHQAPGLLQKW